MKTNEANTILKQAETFPSGSRTLRMIYNETPFGCVVIDAGYLAVCDLVERLAKTSLHRFAKLTCIDIWGMTPREAASAILCWNRDFMGDEINRRDWFEREKLFWGGSHIQPPPREV